MEGNDQVNASANLFKLTGVGQTPEYEQLLRQRQELLGTFRELLLLEQTGVITAPFDGTVQSVTAGMGVLCSLSPDDVMTVSVNVDELDILSMQTGQEAAVTIYALDHANLRIERGEFVGIIGPSGSGKSTLMNIMGCLDLATSGSYELDGQIVEYYTEEELSRVRSKKIGFIFQNFNPISKLSAEENVELPLIYQRLPRRERQEQVEQALNQVGLWQRKKHTPTELSGGQQQRVAIARALAARPALFLADEPTGNLDSRTTDEIMDIFRELHEQGSTIVLITHDNSVAAQAARRVRIQDDHGHPLELDDMSVIMEEGVGLAAPLGQTYATGKYGRESDSFIVYGTTAVYPSVNHLPVEYGTFLRQSNVDNHSCVVVISHAAALDLMGTLDCLGENIMLNGVPFRIIGIRKAIGASRRTILLQFLIEALVLSLLGCALGLALSAFTLGIVSTATGIASYVVDPRVAVVSIGFSSLIGLIFGLHPANKAAGKPPIEALRHSGYKCALGIKKRPPYTAGVQ